MYTYIIESQGLYKIGKALNIEKRLKGYRTHNPTFQLVKTIPGDYENILHKAYWEKRSHLEWYKLSQEDVDEIENIVTRTPEEEKAAIQYSTFQPMKLRELEVYTSIVKSAKNRNLIMDLTASAQRMYMYVVYSIVPGTATVELSPAIYAEALQSRSSRNIYKKAIQELLDVEYLIKTDKKYIYKVNPMITYCKKYVPKDKQVIESRNIHKI